MIILSLHKTFVQLTILYIIESLKNSDYTAIFSQTESFATSTKVKRTMMKIYTKHSNKEFNAFLFFENHIRNVNLIKVTWKRSDSMYWDLCTKNDTKNISKQLSYFLTKQLKACELKEINEFEKYNVKIKIFDINAKTLQYLIFRESHEFERMNTNNDFHSNIMNTNILWFNAKFKKIKKDFDNEKSKNEIIIIIIKCARIK